MSPRRAMLLSQVPICFCHLFRIQQTVLSTFSLAHLLKSICPHHLAKRIRCINRTIDHDVRDMDIPRTILRIQRLTKHSSSAHCCGVGMLTGITPNGGS